MTTCLPALNLGREEIRFHVRETEGRVRHEALLRIILLPLITGQNAHGI
jgi:hypothetical protein